jgi:hypothetical protein
MSRLCRLLFVFDRYQSSQTLAGAASRQTGRYPETGLEEINAIPPKLTSSPE